MREFEDAVVVVTGSATGLGAALAIGAAEQGAKAVILNCTKSLAEAEATARLVRAAGAEATVVQGDVSDDAACRAIAAAAEQYGRIDALANNAGTTKQVPNHADLDGLSAEDFHRIYSVNVVGPLNVSSIAGVTGIGSSVAYAASKGAFNTMTKSLARALAPRIRVNAICPGFIDTRWFSDAFGEELTARIRANVIASVPLQAASTPEDIAASGLFFLSRASRHVTGETLLVDAGLHLGPNLSARSL